jgi:hypothetical protein
LNSFDSKDKRTVKIRCSAILRIRFINYGYPGIGIPFEVLFFPQYFYFLDRLFDKSKVILVLSVSS